MEKKIKAMFIFEMIGRPPDYIKETLNSYVDNLEIEGVKILYKKIHEPKIIEKEEIESSLYSTFAEVELEVDNLNLLFGIEFRMLPSHVEIIEPSELVLKNFDLSAIMSDLAIKLHRYDEVAKVLSIEKNNLEMQLKELKTNVPKIKIEEIRGQTDKPESLKNKKKKK